MATKHRGHDYITVAADQGGITKVSEKDCQSVTARATAAFTHFDQLPLVCSLEDAARALNVSATTLRRRLAAGQFVPGVMPRQGQQPWEFSKSQIQKYLEGGYSALRIARRRA